MTPVGYSMRHSFTVRSALALNYLRWIIDLCLLRVRVCEPGCCPLFVCARAFVCVHMCVHTYAYVRVGEGARVGVGSAALRCAIHRRWCTCPAGHARLRRHLRFSPEDLALFSTGWGRNHLYSSRGTRPTLLVHDKHALPVAIHRNPKPRKPLA